MCRYAVRHYTVCRHAERHLLCVTQLSLSRLIVVMQCVIIPDVVAPVISGNRSLYLYCRIVLVCRYSAFSTSKSLIFRNLKILSFKNKN